MHYESIIGYLESRFRQVQGKAPRTPQILKEIQDYSGLAQWLLEMVYWILYWFMGSFDDAVVRSICGSNDENLCAWWVADVVATGHMNNRNGSGSGLAARDPSFWCRASSLTAMVGIVHGRSIVAAV